MLNVSCSLKSVHDVMVNSEASVLIAHLIYIFIIFRLT